MAVHHSATHTLLLRNRTPSQSAICPCRTACPLPRAGIPLLAHLRSYFFSNSPVMWRFTKVVLPDRREEGEGHANAKAK